MTSRPGWDDWAMGIAEAVARRADCTRRQVGAVILDYERRVVSTGYNGAHPGGPSCLKGQCPRGRHYRVEQDCRCIICGLYMCDHPEVVCACGGPWPCPEAVPEGSSYDTGPGRCISTHAELNALLYADRSRLPDSTLYVTTAPCDGCLKILNNTPISRIFWPDGKIYR